MALTINTNVSSLIAQKNLDSATKALNASLERMSTGYTINHASDNAAGYSIAKQWVTHLSSLDVTSKNAATGADMLTTAEDSYSLLTGHLQRVRDLTEQAANGTYGSASLKAIQAEVVARLQEINRISANIEFNGIKLMSYSKKTGADNSEVGITADGVNIQVGLYAEKNSRINLSVDLFSDASMSGLFAGMSSVTSESGKTLAQLMTGAGGNISNLLNNANLQAFAAACSGLKYRSATNDFVLQTDATMGAKEMLSFLDGAINDISGRVTQLGAAQNRISSALSALDVQSQNLTSSLSTLRDTDVAKESSTYIQSQILQQASATLLSTANQLPSVALNLI
ncbi:MAG: hypothetical protein MJ230_03475 [bacterium]|nr:hypothetical protein [bacterium]